MRKIPSSDFLAILRTLSDHRVDFIVVGGVGAVLHGVPINTFDLDVVHSRAPDNINRLLQALHALNAHYQVQQASHRLSPGHQLVMTSFGPLDLLGAIGHGRQYEDLVNQSVEMDLGESVKARVLNLDLLIQVKEEIAGQKDKAGLPVMRRTLEEKSRRRRT